MDKLKTRLFLVLVCFVVLAFVQNVQAKVQSDTLVESIKVREHSPHKATVYSALVPGLGQIYNKKYWKLPILYGGIGATVYAIGWNSNQYNDYKDAYIDFSLFLDYKYQPEGGTIPEPTSKRYEKLRPDEDFENLDPKVETWYQTRFKNGKDKYKRDRDLSYIILFGVYVLNIIDATVDAHFTNFNINDDLSMTVQPQMNYTPLTGGFLGLSCRIEF